MEEYLDPGVCPTVALAMGMNGMLNGYPLIEPIEFVCELDRCPEEPEYEILIEEEYY